MILFLIGVMVGAIAGMFVMALIAGSHTPDDEEIEMEMYQRNLEAMLDEEVK